MVGDLRGNTNARRQLLRLHAHQRFREGKIKVPEWAAANHEIRYNSAPGIDLGNLWLSHWSAAVEAPRSIEQELKEVNWLRLKFSNASN